VLLILSGLGFTIAARFFGAHCPEEAWREDLVVFLEVA
jgi:hypothetical protein